MNAIKLYSADCRGVESNCNYPHEHIITDVKALRNAVQHDYVCVLYENNYRSKDNFRISNCLGQDCDNDYSDDPANWVTPEDVQAKFRDVPHLIHYSRNHGKSKHGKSARPRFHVFFLIDEMTDHTAYSDLKKRVRSVFPFFDKKALDAARFFFGTENPEVEFYPGTITLNECLDKYYPEDDGTAEDWDDENSFSGIIPEGSRNATMSHFAGRVLKRFGDSEEAYEAFQQRAAQCDPPLDDSELNTIWHSAQGFYKRILTDESYIPPEQWNANPTDKFIYDPEDRTDVGQARVLGKHFGRELRYSPATDYIRYDGTCWQESKPGAQAVAHALTDRQLKEAQNAIFYAHKQMKTTGAQNLIDESGEKKAHEQMNDEQLVACNALTHANSYRSFALKRRESRNITATLKEARPVLEIDPGTLDRDWFLLCTPDATYDLRKGISGAQSHNPDDFITKMTACSPGNQGSEIWQDALNTVFCGDPALIQYVQRVAGLVCVGQVFQEAMIISYGDGRNGKSTFWNALSRVMGSYSGNISADSLTMNCKRNVKPEMAETKGKRLLIASELEEGTRLNTSTVKQLCSTDAIFAEKKYKAPFSFTPSHTLVLYTNHLPKVGAKDTGIWRRLIVIPFKAKIEGRSDIKNYTDYLYDNAREAILQWMLDGAQQAIELEFKIPLPSCVTEAIEAYKAENDWLGHFFDECCEIGDDLQAKSGELYTAYRTYCVTNGEYIRSTTDFYAALDAEGYVRYKLHSGMIVKGLQLRLIRNDVQGEFQDFLQ